MIEISAIVLSLLIEAYVILLIAFISWIYFSSKKKKNDRHAALKLVDQIRQQSEARQASTSSYLKKKYNLEGPQLKKAIIAIDKSEKRFFQKVLDLYLNRDAEALGSLDADVAELIETYKSFTPVTTTAVNGGSDKDEQIAILQAANAQLTEELSVTNKTMSDMIAEFGNMFGGGSDNDLEQTEVVEKVIAHHDEELSDDVDIDDILAAETSETEDIVDIAEIDDIAEIADVDIEMEDSINAAVDSEGDIDDILNGIISPEDKAKV